MGAVDGSGSARYAEHAGLGALEQTRKNARKAKALYYCNGRGSLGRPVRGMTQHGGHGEEELSVTIQTSKAGSAGGVPVADPAEWSRSVASRTRAAGGRAHANTEAGWPPFLESPFVGPSGEVTLVLIGGQRLLRDATASLLARKMACGCWGRSSPSIIA